MRFRAEFYLTRLWKRLISLMIKVYFLIQGYFYFFRSAATMNHTWEEMCTSSLTRKLSHQTTVHLFGMNMLVLNNTHSSSFCRSSREEQCKEAFIKFNGRWYAGRQLHCELSPVTRWKNAICGEFLIATSIEGFNLVISWNASFSEAFTPSLYFLISQDCLIDKSAPKENIVTSCMYFETLKMNSGRPIGICTCHQTPVSGEVIEVAAIQRNT